ncbi:MAG: hypothetical protein Q9159_002660 [Coniocarpon cinnabarinum]
MARSISNQANERTALLQSHQEENRSPSITRHAPEAALRETGEGYGTSRLLLMLSGPSLLAFLFALDSTVVATLATPISNEFASLRLLNWLASSFFIANTISQPLAGRLTYVYGRRKGLLVGALLFCIGNSLCAASQSRAAVILGRVIAGLGGGAFGPIATFVVGDLLPLRRRGLWRGTLNVWFGIGSSLGGPIGGIVNDTLNWRASFWIQIPITVLAVLLVCLFLKLPSPALPEEDSAKPKYQLVDFSGALTLSAMFTVLLLTLSAGGDPLQWTSPLITLGLAISLLLLPLFVWLESGHKYAILPPQLFRNSTVIAACATNFFISLARFGLFFYAPVFFLAQGYSTFQAGLRLIPESVAVICTSISTGYIMRLTGRYYYLNIVVSSIYVAAFVVVTATFKTGLAEWMPFVVLFFVGMGFSGQISTTLLAFNASVSQSEQAVITSTSYVFRSTGSALSVTLSSTIFQFLLDKALMAHFGGDRQGKKLSAIARKSTQSMRSLPPPERVTAVYAYVEALQGVWITLLVCAVGAFVAGLFKSEHRLFKKMDRTDEG